MRIWIRDKENLLVSFDYSSTMGETRDDSKTSRKLFSPITIDIVFFFALDLRARPRKI